MPELLALALETNLLMQLHGYDYASRVRVCDDILAGADQREALERENRRLKEGYEDNENGLTR
jgi:hypothetical protein